MKVSRLNPGSVTRRNFLAGSAAAFLLASVNEASPETYLILDSGNRPINSPPSARVLSLNGSDWIIRTDKLDAAPYPDFLDAGKSEPGWIAANVPGNIQADLERAHLLQPLWYGAGDPRLAEVASNDWWYRKDFELPEDFRKKRLRLVFDGIDFEAEVWLNGQPLGTCAGQFRRFEFDIAHMARGGINRDLITTITIACSSRFPNHIRI